MYEATKKFLLGTEGVADEAERALRNLECRVSVD